VCDDGLVTAPPRGTPALPDGPRRLVLAAAVDRVIPEDGYPSATGAGVMNYMDRNAGAGFGETWSLLQIGLDNLDAEAKSRHGTGFSLLSQDQQDEVLAAVEVGEVRTAWHVDPAGFFAALVATTADGFYADPGNGGNRNAISWSMVGYPAPVAHASRGRLPAVLRSHDEVGDRYDAVVVGAGAGGGVAAYVLAAAGLEVLVVERGDALRTDQVPADHLRNHRLARLGHNTGPSLSGNPRVLVTDEGPQVLSPSDPGWNNNAMTLGGGTRVWGAQAWRMSPIDFRMASTYGVPDGSTLADWPISYDDLEPYYDRAEWALGVAGEPGHAHAGHRSRGYPLPPVPLGPTGQRLVTGARRLGWPTAAVPLMVNTAPFGGRPACVRCSQCIGFACPVDAKTGSHNSVLADAVASGHCTVLVGTRVTRVLRGPAGRATGVVLVAEDGAGNAREVRAGGVVLSAGAIETARLLLISAMGGRLVGTSLQGHTYVGAVGLFDEPVTDGAGPGPAIATCRFLHGNEGVVGGGMLADEFVKTPTSFWHTALPPDAPRWGVAGKAAMRDGYRRTAHVMGPIQELPNGAARVQLDHTVTDHLGLPVARLSGHSHPDDYQAAKFLAERALEWMEASGAAKVWPGPTAKSHPRLSAGQHQAGTCRMGSEPATSVCDPTGTLHDSANVVLADGSVHVTNGGINPTLTIMALAWRGAEALASRL
jgi:choline dehydrogenase-like flavoprotein